MPTTADSEAVDPAYFRTVLGHYATGITVVTTVQDGLDHAMTANSFTSVSLDPPLVLVCVDLDTRFYEAITVTGTWAVSVLSEAARPRATWLSMKGRPLAGQLLSVPHRRGPHSGAAILSESLASLECSTWAIHPAGDHVIVIGEVIALNLEDVQASPLLYYTSRYHHLGPQSGRR